MAIALISPALAQAGKPASRPTASAAATDWKNLTPAQRQALEPLHKDWHRLDTFRKEKWIELANRFSTMTPVDQARMQERMRDWVTLSPEQRRLAREHYQRVKKLNVEKNRRWKQYQQLPEEKKKELATSATPRKHLTNPPRKKSQAPSATTSVPASPATPPASVSESHSDAAPPEPVELPQPQSLPVQSSPSPP